MPYLLLCAFQSGGERQVGVCPDLALALGTGLALSGLLRVLNEMVMVVLALLPGKNLDLGSLSYLSCSGQHQD